MNKKFCRFSSECGKNENCLGTFFGLKKGNCSSKTGKCRFNSSCPKYYQCVNNDGGLAEGKCLLAISKNNPLSKSIAGMSTALLDPASTFRNSQSVNKTMIFIVILISSALIYLLTLIIGKIVPEDDGVCRTSSDCVVNMHYLPPLSSSDGDRGPEGMTWAPGAQQPPSRKIRFQCGIIDLPPTEGGTSAPSAMPTIIPGRCDCKTILGGKAGNAIGKINQKIASCLIGGEIIESSVNCKLCSGIASTPPFLLNNVNVPMKKD